MEQEFKTYTLALDMVRTIGQPPFEVVWGDTGNVLNVTLTNDGEAVGLADKYVCVVFRSGIGTALQDRTNGLTLSETPGVFSLALLPQSYGAGEVSADVQVYSGEDRATLITSRRFTFRCRNALLNDRTMQANGTYPPLIAATHEATEAAAAARAAVAQLIVQNGDMVQSVYDTDSDGVVDAAETAVIAADAARLGGNLPAYYASAADMAALTPSDVGAAPASHAAQHASGGADPAAWRFTADIPVSWALTPQVRAETTVADGSVDADPAAFAAAVENTPGTYVLTYDGTNAYWTLDGAEAPLAAYGLTLAGAPADADTLTVTYTEAEPYTQQVAVAGMTADMRPKCDILFDGADALEERIAQKEAWLCVDDADSGAGTLTLICFETAPETAFTIQMEVTA